MQLTQFITLTTTLFAAASVAAPSPKTSPKATVTIIATDKSVNSKTTLNIPLGQLTHPSDATWTTLKVDKLTIANAQAYPPPPKIDNINCQMYKDKDSLYLETFRFNKTTNAESDVLTTQKNLSLGWILCYVEGGSAPAGL